MTALLGRIPIDGKVTDPYPFKVMIGKDNLTANGIELPDVQGRLFQAPPQETGRFPAYAVPLQASLSSLLMAPFVRFLHLRDKAVMAVIRTARVGITAVLAGYPMTTAFPAFQVPENQTLLLICPPSPHLPPPAQRVMPWLKTRIPVRQMDTVG